MSQSDKKTYYLIDGSGFIFRAFHALPSMNRPSDGVPVNAVYGFTNMLMRLLADTGADYIAVIFDASDKTFRNDIYADYKANRSETPEELVPQFSLIRDATRAFNLEPMELDGYEADDLIATYCRLARERGDEAVIVSSDKDLMQLVGGTVTMLDPMKNRVIGEAEVVEKFGVLPDKVVDVQSLAGDSVDNVPGVPGIGVKTAAQLIGEYGDLDSLLERAEEIKQPKRRQNLIDHAEMARISRELVRLDTQVDVPVSLDDLVVHEPDGAQLAAFLREQGFKSIVARVEAAYGGGSEGATEAGGEAQAPLAEAEYELVTDLARLEAWVQDAHEAGAVAVDTETTSVNASSAKLVGISLSTAPGNGCYIPVGHVAPAGDDALDLQGEGEAPEQISPEAAIAALKPLLEDPAVLKIGQNIKYDYQILARHGVRLHPVDDTMLLSYVIDGMTHGHGMDELAERHLNHTTIKYSDLCGTGKNQITFDRVPLDKALGYAAEDADITLRLHKLLKRRLVAERKVTLYESVERPLAEVVGEMEFNGIKVDLETLKRMSSDFGNRIVELEAKVHELAGHPFNIGSPKQLGTVLFDEMGIQGGKKTKTGAYATGVEVLKPLAAKGYDIAERVLDWRELSKLKSTYTDALQGQINPATGRVHTSYAMAIVSTGRLSSNDPNLQNIPIRTEEGRRIREAFVAEEGAKLISADYSQIELRLVAEIAGVEALKEAFRAGDDIHALTASQVFGVPMDEMTPEVRRKAKAINFGIIYGISGFGLGQQLGIETREAGDFIKQYLERYSELKDWMEATKELAREQGFVTTLFGRHCHVPSIREKNPAKRSFAERQAINAPIQGSAADVIKRAMSRVGPALKDAGLDARLLLQVHDELIFEAPVDQAEKTAAVVVEVMQAAATLSIPLVADAGIGDTWGQAH
ncbi:MAG: DNA polymerase I [Pseudomonadota bacterium]